MKNVNDRQETLRMRQSKTLMSSSMVILMIMMTTSYPDMDHSLHLFPLNPTAVRLVAPTLLCLLFLQRQTLPWQPYFSI